MESFLRVVLVFASFVCASAQESITMYEGLKPHIGVQAIIALVICFGILATCAIGTNIITRMFQKRMGTH